MPTAWSLRKLGNPQPDVYAWPMWQDALRSSSADRAATPSARAQRHVPCWVLKNPGKVARANRYKSGAYCAGVYLEVTLRDPAAEKLVIPLWGRELKRGSMAYRQVMESAGTVRAAFDEMIEGVRRG